MTEYHLSLYLGINALFLWFLIGLFLSVLTSANARVLIEHTPWNKYIGKKLFLILLSIYPGPYGGWVFVSLLNSYWKVANEQDDSYYKFYDRRFCEKR